MKTLTIVSCLIVAVALAVPALAGPPLNGVYKSIDLPGGVLPTGRYSESWTVPNGYLTPGNTSKGESWDGLNLGTVWRFECPTIAFPPMLLFSTVNPLTGTGTESWMKTYTGGTFFLSGAGPWGNGDPQYTGTLTSYVEFENINFLSFARVGGTTNVQASGSFNGFPASCVSFAASNGAWISDTGAGPKPATYPAFLQQFVCTPTATMGSWWNLTAVTITISGCAVPVEETTWGNIKALYE